MIARAVNHVSFCVDDLPAALEFYCGVLGLETVDRPEMGLPGAWLRAESGTEVHLIVPPEGYESGSPPPKLTPLANHTAFSIEDYSSVLGHLRAAGLDVIETTPERGQMWVTDPSGNVIELTTGQRR